MVSVAFCPCVGVIGLLTDRRHVMANYKILRVTVVMICGSLSLGFRRDVSRITRSLEDIDE